MKSVLISLTCLLSFLQILSCKSPESSSKSPNPAVIPVQSDEVGEIKTTKMIAYVSFPDGYFVKNNVLLTADYEAFLFTNRADFDKVIGFGKTATNNSIIIDFDEKNVVAVTHKPSEQSVKFLIRNVLMSDGVLKVNFQTSTLGTNTYKSQPVYLIYFNKSDSGTSNQVIVDGKPIKLNDKF